jgi:GNAT superfamily N-acetyltransferase
MGTNNYTIRLYNEMDAAEVGILIADVYSQFNLSFATGDHLKALLGPFYYAQSKDPAHQQAIVDVLGSPMMYVAETEDEIIGVLRGREGVLASLFVHEDHHRRGIARRLVNVFEDDSRLLDVSVIKVAATLYAVPFYLDMGYKRTTGVRPCWSFGGQGLLYQPMKKVLVGID